ncbi:MAG: ABC transporter permease [Actinomycetales bacterium]|nr:ABC transporter permease [Actinomycetales bacterium]
MTAPDGTGTTVDPTAGGSGPGTAGAAELRTGPRYWVSCYPRMVAWQFATLRLYLPVLAVVQVLAGVGFVLGIGLFFPGEVPHRSAVYVSTGVPVINLYLLGLVLLPQVIGQQRLAKTYDFTQSLPVPRSVGFAAWYTMTLLVGAPAVVATLAAAALRYDPGFAVSLAVVPAAALVCLTATAVGQAMAHAVAEPMVVQVLTQILNFLAIGFAPVCMPPEQLPDWLVTVNRWLPFDAMAVVMRSALVEQPVAGVARACLVLAAWTAACLALAGWAVGRRG